MRVDDNDWKTWGALAAKPVPEGCTRVLVPTRTSGAATEQLYGAVTLPALPWDDKPVKGAWEERNG